jgi:putative transposase
VRSSIDRLDKSMRKPYFNRMNRTEDQLQKLYKTFSFRVKDATSGKRLVALGNAVNTVWNYCNEISIKSAERGPKWITKNELRDLTKGASREIGLPSQVVQEVIDEFIIKRRAHGKPRLRWRVSHGPKRSLGWVPFTNQDIAIDGATVLLRGQAFHIWKHRDIDGKIKSGSFNQDARGRWYCNLVVEVERPAATNRQKIVGIDLGFTTVAMAHNAPDLDQATFYRDLEPKLAEAQRRGRKRQIRTLHAKIANRRKDTLHKYSRTVVDEAGAVFVGNVSPQWQIASGKAKATLDMSWSTLRNLLRYKCDHAGVAFAEVNESYTTQTCSDCGVIGGPKGREGLGVRQWVCGDCGAVHDRDRNAAVNIARIGCDTLGLKWPGSSGL